jgi:hypothetical protein
MMEGIGRDGKEGFIGVERRCASWLSCPAFGPGIACRSDSPVLGVISHSGLGGGSLAVRAAYPPPPLVARRLSPRSHCLASECRQSPGSSH